MTQLPPEMTDEEIDAMLDGEPRDLNFSGRNLNHQAICDENLSGADFRRSFLVKAELCDSVLNSAQFESADLFRAELCGASCVAADFRGARLAGAGLARTDLSSTNFEGCDLHHAHFNKARFDSRTNFRGAFGTPLRVDFILVDGVRLDGEEAARWLRERIAPGKATDAP